MNNEQMEIEQKIKQNMENIISTYFKQFLNKFDSRHFSSFNFIA